MSSARVTGTAGALDTQFGVSIPRNVPTGFVVEITGAYDPDTGYPWSELRGVPGTGFTAPLLPLTGTNAYEITGNTALAVGTVGVLTLDRDQMTYALVVPASSGPEGTCTGCGWVAGLRTSAGADCLAISVNGVSQYVYMSNSGTEFWYSNSPITICGNEYNVSFTPFQSLSGDSSGDGTVPVLTLTTVSGSSVTYHSRWNCCGCAYADFTFGLSSLCSGESYPGSPCTNVVHVRVDWAPECCTLSGWAGAGWYCVVGVGVNCANASAVELIDSDCTDNGITICSGPYATEAAAAAVCTGSPSTACCSTVPTELTLTVSGFTGICACANGTFNLVYVGVIGTNPSWCATTQISGSCPTTGGSDNATWILSCYSTPSVGWQVNLNQGCTIFGNAFGSINLSGTCSPFSLSGSSAVATCGVPSFTVVPT